MISSKNLFQHVSIQNFIFLWPFLSPFVLSFFWFSVTQTFCSPPSCRCSSQCQTSMTQFHSQALVSTTLWTLSSTSGLSWLLVDHSADPHSQSQSLPPTSVLHSSNLWWLPRLPRSHLWPGSWRAGSWCCRDFCRQGKNCCCEWRHVWRRWSLGDGKTCWRLWESGTGWHCFLTLGKSWQTVLQCCCWSNWQILVQKLGKKVASVKRFWMRKWEIFWTGWDWSSFWGCGFFLILKDRFNNLPSPWYLKDHSLEVVYERNQDFFWTQRLFNFLIRWHRQNYHNRGSHHQQVGQWRSYLQFIVLPFGFFLILSEVNFREFH